MVMSYLSRIDPEKEYDHKDIWDYVNERDNGMCVLCASRNWTEQHHIIYRSHKGKTKTLNLATLCKKCHTEKAHGKKNEYVEKLLDIIKKREEKFRENIIGA